MTGLLLRGIAYMVLYNFIEVVWKSFYKPDPATGRHQFRPTVFGSSAPCAAPFYGLAGIFVLEPYQQWANFDQFGHWPNIVMRAFWFPFVIWAIEVTIGSVLWYPSKWLWGNRYWKGQGIRAWFYYGPYALVNKFTNMRLYFDWVALGFAFEFVSPWLRCYI